jgi:hypothetical protein
VNRRLLGVLAGGLALVGVSSCSTVRPNAAKVGDVEIRRDGFERDMQKLAGTSIGSIVQVRTWLTDRIRFATATRAVSDQRLTVTDDNRTKGEALAKTEWTGYDNLPAELKSLLQEGFAAEVALAATQPSTSDQTVKEALGDDPNALLCFTAIPATDAADAKTVIADLASGKSVDDVVVPRVAGTDFEASKGAVVTSDGTCPPAAQINQTVTAALADVKLNTPSAPVQLTDSSTGNSVWYVFVPTKAGDTDAKSIVAALKAAALSVAVDARYGHWDSETQTVVAGAAPDLG